MKKTKRVVITLLIVITLMCFLVQPALALDESDVQDRIDEIGKDAVTGNVLIWFLCAIAFLKVSQKIDSFMSSLGINVGHTGSSMLSEAMIATRGLGAARAVSGAMRGHGSGGGSDGAGFLSGGLAGVVSRKVTAGAVKSVTSVENNGSSTGHRSPGGIGGSIYSSSVAKGGSFANKVIGSIAHGDVSTMGSITGDRAVEAMNSYMGNAALEPGAQGVPTYSNVEIGGGKITGTETSEEHPEGIAFGMYSTAQYTAPDGDYTTVHTADGASWYRQYAVDAVQRTPYVAPDGKIAYNESLIKKLPPIPKRKDRT